MKADRRLLLLTIPTAPLLWISLTSRWPRWYWPERYASYKVFA